VLTFPALLDDGVRLQVEPRTSRGELAWFRRGRIAENRESREGCADKRDHDRPSDAERTIRFHHDALAFI
jgi:hypothetical protein